MNILRLMGCDSRQFASMERYLVRACKVATTRGDRFFVAYDNAPRSADFIERLEGAGGYLLELGAVGPTRRFFADLDAAVKDKKIDVIHGYFTPACHYAMAFAAARGIRGRLRTSANNPLTTRLAAGPMSPQARLRFAVTQRALASLPRRILALSHAMRDEFASLGVSGERVQVVNGGVDDAHFVPADADRRKRARDWLGVTDEVVVVTAARLVPVKRLDVLVHAVAGLPQVRLVIAGEGPLKADLEREASQLGLEGRVSLIGQLPDARQLLAAADVFALPTLSEGLSNSLMEAMACALPVVATDIAANAEVVTDAENGYLVRPGDVGSLADALGGLAADADLRGRLGRAGRERVEKHFNVGRRVAEEFAVYESLVD